jgi:division protein CdvB (Snf7/Vps24/ESCRT-III family)
MSFSNKWIKPQNEINNVGMKLLENIKPPSPLKPRIEEAQKRLHSQIAKLENMSMKMEEKDQVIFKRVISAMQSHDSQYAKILSNELSQIRKMNKMITSAKLALEQIQLRLNTITELGDVIVTLSPAMSVIKNIQGGLTSMMPEAGQSFGKITDILNGIMNESGQIPQTTEMTGNTNAISEDAMKIIEEASAILALEQIQLRLNTITELGDVIVTLSPAMSVIKNIQGGLTSMMPEAGQSFGKITDILNGIMNESGQSPQTTEMTGNTNAISEDAMKIIEEASAIVEQNMKDKFPDLPNTAIDSKVTESNSLY